jgi:hypothetical protein
MDKIRFGQVGAVGYTRSLESVELRLAVLWGDRSGAKTWINKVMAELTECSV